MKSNFLVGISTNSRLYVGCIWLLHYWQNHSGVPRGQRGRFVSGGILGAAKKGKNKKRKGEKREKEKRGREKRKYGRSMYLQ